MAAYRTLDLPAPLGLLQVARGPWDDPRTLEALRVAGVGLRVLDPIETRALGRRSSPDREIITDPVLAAELYGADLAALTGLRDFALVRIPGTPSTAWLLPRKGLTEQDGMANPLAMLARFRFATPLPSTSEVPERAEVEVRVADPSPSMVVLSKTYDPEWRAWWTNDAGDRRSGEVVRVLGGWQGVVVPEPGKWTLHLEYSGRSTWLGLALASTAWSVWLVGFARKPRPILPEESK